MSKSTIPKTASGKLLAASKNVPKPPAPNTPPDFLRKMLHFPDPQEAAKILAEQAGLDFDCGKGAEIEALKLDRIDLDERYKASHSRLKELETKRNSTKEFIKSAINGERQDFFQWKRLDQISMLVIYLSLLAVLVMSGANVYANLMASGEIIFLENPWIAISLSMLMPSGSVALKFLSGFFTNPATKRRYTLCLYISAAALLIAWMSAFALTFDGAASGIDWDNIGESDGGKGALLVWLQLAAELSVAGALFMAAEDIHLKYAPDHFIQNSEFIESARALKAHNQDHEALKEKRNATHAKIIALEKSRQVHINEVLAAFFAAKSKLNAMNHF